MDGVLGKLDWSLVQVFLAVAEEGSLSAAARRLGASQPTVGRQIKAVEEALPMPVFARHARGFELTEFGRTLLPAATAMQRAANDLRLAAMAQDTEIAGTVRITASRMASFVTLPRIIAKLRQEFPNLQVDLVSTDDTENLLYGASDIAVRMYRPEQLDLVTQYIGEVTFGCYVAKSYVADHGMPNGLEDALARDLVGYDTITRLIDGLRDYGLPASREMFATRCDDS
ncbi:MAG: LysR family transcriptional regulator, partial [Pseudomonadota bacterium]